MQGERNMIKNEIKFDDIQWFIYKNHYAYPYITNHDGTKIKVLTENRVFPITKNNDGNLYRDIHDTIQKYYGNFAYHCDNQSIISNYLTKFQWKLISGGKSRNEVCINDLKLKLLKFFIEHNYEKKLKRFYKQSDQEYKKSQSNFDELDF